MVSASPLKIIELDVSLELFKDEDDVIPNCKELISAAEDTPQQLEEREGKESDTDSSIIQPINKTRLLRKQKRRIQCGTCPGCKREDCGVCSYCKGMIKFGGNGKLKKRCRRRECQYMFKAINESIIGKYFKDSTSPESATPSPSKTTPPSNDHVPVAKRRKLSSILDESPLPSSKPLHSTATPTPIIAMATKKVGLMKRPSSPRHFSSPKKGSLLRQPNRGSPRKLSPALQFGIFKREDLTPPTDHAPYKGLIHVCRGQLSGNDNTTIPSQSLKPVPIHNPIPATSMGMNLSLLGSAGILPDIGVCCHGDPPPTRGDVLTSIKDMYPYNNVEGVLERYLSVRKQLDPVVMTTCHAQSIPSNIPGTPDSAYPVKENRKRGRPRGSGRGLSPKGRGGLSCSIAVTRDPKGLIIVNVDSYTTKSVATPISGCGQQSSPRKRRTSFRLAQERLTKEAESGAELKIELITNKENKKPLICRVTTPIETRPHPQGEPPSCAFGVYQWNHLYRPIRSCDIIGNKMGVAKIHDWLSKWKSSSNNGRGIVMNKQSCHDNAGPHPIRRRRQRLIDLNESLNSSFCSNEGEEPQEVGVALLVCGPVGCGKTAAVYACAEELGYKVLEVNSAHCRSRQNLLGILREATQSHHVGIQAPPPVTTVTKSMATPSAPPKGLMAFFKLKQPTNQKQPSKQHDVVAEKQVAMETNTLMLLEEVDLLYEDERRGFWSAITEIVQDAKRPLIFTVNDNEIELPFQHSKIVLNTPSVDDIALHCQLLSLSHDSHMTHSTALQLVSHTGNDIRRIFNVLHFYLNTKKEGAWQKGAESLKGTGMPLNGLEHQLISGHTLSSIKDLPQLISCITLLHHVHTHLTDRLLPFLVSAVQPVQTTPPQTTPTTHSYEHLDRCVRICDGLAHSDVITKSCDSYSMSHDVHVPWWQSHVTTSLIDDLPLRSPLDLTGQYGIALEACLILGEGTGTWEPDCGRMGDKQYIREAHDCHMTSCEVFSVRSELARRPLMTECLPYLQLICRKEKEREQEHCTTSRRRFTHYLTHSGVGLQSFNELVDKCSYDNCKN